MFLTRLQGARTALAKLEFIFVNYILLSSIYSNREEFVHRRNKGAKLSDEELVLLFFYVILVPVLHLLHPCSHRIAATLTSTPKSWG